MTYRTHAGFSVHLQAMTTPRELADRLEENAKIFGSTYVGKLDREAATMLRALAEQQEQNAKDAERYREWRRLAIETMDPNTTRTACDLWEAIIVANTEEELDAAVDAARTAQEPKT